MIPLLIITTLLIAAASGAVFSPRPVHAALMLALTLGLTAALYLAIGAEFFGLVQLLVYVGAVAVLIVFVLLLTRAEDERAETRRSLRTVAAALAGVLPVAGILIGVVVTSPSLAQRAAEPSPLTVRAIGELLFTTHVVAVLAIGALLTATLIGAALFVRETPGEPVRQPAP